MKTKLTFKQWMQIVADLDNNQFFMLEGYQAGEIFEWHEWYIKGMSPKEAVERNWELYS